MAVHYIGDSDAATGDPSTPLDQTWDNSDVDLPGIFQKGRGFVPRTSLAPVGPARGLTLSGPSGGAATQGGPDIFSPNRPINPTRQVGPFTGGTSTDGSFRPGEPIPGGGGGGGLFSNIANLFGGGNPYWRGAIAAGGVLQPTPAETGELPAKYWPNASPGMPDHPSTMRYPSWPTPPAPAAAAPVSSGGIGSDANRPVLGAGGFPTTYAPPGQQPAPLAPDGSPAPIGSPAPAVPPRRPKAAPGGAVAKQKPNLGQYGAFTTVSAPNIDPLRRGRLGDPQITALDLSRLFGGNRQ